MVKNQHFRQKLVKNQNFRQKVGQKSKLWPDVEIFPHTVWSKIKSLAKNERFVQKSDRSAR